jgi:hypothetical protein
MSVLKAAAIYSRSCARCSGKQQRGHQCWLQSYLQCFGSVGTANITVGAGELGDCQRLVVGRPASACRSVGWQAATVLAAAEGAVTEGDAALCSEADGVAAFGGQCRHSKTVKVD